MSIGPQLTAWDLRVLGALSVSVRLRVVALRLRADERDVRLTLRGLEHLGYARCAGGWWRWTERGQRLYDAMVAA